jgi:hemerythrin superfamily protein
MTNEKKPLLLTPEKIDQASQLLAEAGYDAKIKDWGEHGVDVNIRNSDKYAQLLYDDYQGFYISTTATWLNDKESIELFATNLQKAKDVISKISSL